MVEIKLANGELRKVEISNFSALEGWEIQNRFIEFASSSDRDFRREFTFEVLAYAKVMVGGVEIPLKTDALINNHLQGWQNIKIVFEAVLMQNGIDPNTHADRPNYWSEAGAEMAVSFIAEAAKLMGPALYTIAKSQE
jgi:hypothetical protein